MHTHTSAFALLFDQRQFVSVSIGALQEERRATALELPMWDDGNAISQKVCFIHVVGGQQDGAAWGRGRTHIQVLSIQIQQVFCMTANVKTKKRQEVYCHWIAWRGLSDYQDMKPCPRCPAFFSNTIRENRRLVCTLPLRVVLFMFLQRFLEGEIFPIFPLVTVAHPAAHRAVPHRRTTLCAQHALPNIFKAAASVVMRLGVIKL